MIRYFFIPPGLQASIEDNKIIFPASPQFGSFNKGISFLCDVGSYLGDGIIDHHTLDKENECATTLIYSESSKFLDAILLPNAPEYNVVTHFDPDFDAIGCSYFVTKKLKKEAVSDKFSILANYILDVDLGKIQLDENSIITPFSLILAIAHIINTKYINIINDAPKEKKFDLVIKKNEEVLLRSYQLIDFILGKLDSGFGINDNLIFRDAGEFSEEIELLNMDHKEYIDDFNNSFKYKISLLKKGTDESDITDLIITDRPGSVLWKYWVRGDRKHTKSGFVFTCAFLNSYQSINRNRAIIAVDRTTDYTLKGLGLALDEAEMRKTISLNNSLSRDELNSFLQTSSEKRRNRYHRGDPWFDERDEFTIIDSPREGSLLSNEDITEIVLANEYWQSLSKKKIDTKDDFLCDIDILFPDLFQNHEISFEQPFWKEFFDKFDTGIFDSLLLEKLISELRIDLLSTGEEHIRKGIQLLSFGFLKLSKIPKSYPLSGSRIQETKDLFLSLSREALIKSGFNEEIYLQKEILKILYFYYESKILREILPGFRIIHTESFSKYFLYSTRKMNYREILSYSILLIEKNDINQLLLLQQIINETLTDEIKKAEYNSVFNTLILLKRQSVISYTSIQHPISAFDDWKDIIDDYLFFKEDNINSEPLISCFIKQDSSFFLDPELTISGYEIFFNNFRRIKDEIIFNDSFWKNYINTKSDIEHKFNKDNRFNILRKFTRTYINNCTCIEFAPLRDLINRIFKTGNKNVPSEFISASELIYSIKIFDDLLLRIKLIANVNYLNHSLESFEISDESANSSKVLSNTYPLLNTLIKYLKLLITSQYLPDISHYRSETQEIIQEFSLSVSNIQNFAYSKKQSSLFLNLKDILELVNQKNSLLSSDYELKLNILENILFKIDSKENNLLEEIDSTFSEPDKSIVKEIIFTLKCQLITEKTFLNNRIKNNLKNENKESRTLLKAILNDIIKEATKDELRKAKQAIDLFNDQNLKNRFYEKIVKPFRILSFHSSQALSPDSESDLLIFSKDIRKYILSIPELTEAKLETGINFIEKHHYSVPNVDPSAFLNVIILSQQTPTDANLLPESINVETYEFLINHFLNKYSIDDAREKIEEYTISKYSKIFKFLTSWWILVILLASIGFTFLKSAYENNDFINVVNGCLLSVITFLPLALLLIFIIRFIVTSVRRKIKKKSPDDDNKSVYAHLRTYGANRIGKLSLRLLLFEFMVPLALGILAAVQDNNLLFGLLKINDFRLFAILPIIISLGYYSLFNNISSKNKNFSGAELNKTTFKIYIILFTQSWIITVSLLNILVRYIFIDQNTFNTSWTQVLSVGKVVNFYGLDYLIFPSGAIIITFISLFIGLFVESFNMKSKES